MRGRDRAGTRARPGEDSRAHHTWQICLEFLFYVWPVLRIFISQGPCYCVAKLRSLRSNGIIAPTLHQM